MEHIPTHDAIIVEGLGKRYGAKTVVDDVNLRIPTGEVFGLLGSNGAGKSTTVEMIAGLRRPDQGTVRVFGLDPQADRNRVRQILGIQLQNAALHFNLTVAELIKLFHSFYANPMPAEELIELVDLQDQANTQFDNLSGGQAQRLSVAVALAGQPHVVILDELTTGLDPGARRRMWKTLEKLRDQAITVVLVSHAMDEVERLCDRIAVMDEGRIIALDSPAGVTESAGGSNLEDAFLTLTGKELEEAS